MQSKLGNMIKLIAAGFILLGMAACTDTFTDHGYVPTQAELDKVNIGADDRSSVTGSIGGPSTAGVLQDGAWYWISSRVRYRTYRKPEMISRTIVAISFDNNDRVENIERFGIEDGRIISFSRRVTSSGVGSTTFFSQLISNLGNFAPDEFLEDGR